MTPITFKLAALSLNMNSPSEAGKSIADIIAFLLQKMPPEKRYESFQNIKDKISRLDPVQISIKNMPDTASLGQAITFVKTVLQGKPSTYIGLVLEEIIRNLK